MTTIIDDENVAHEIYEGPPDDLRRHIDGSQDDLADIAHHMMRTFMAPSQSTTKETLEWYNDESQSPPFDPDGMCLKVCRTARNIGPMFASALEAQQETPNEHRVSKIEDIHRGMVMYFDTVGDSNPYGHIVTVAGRDKNKPASSLASLIVWTNSVVANKLVKVRADYFPLHWGDKFQFGATWLNGQELKFPEPKPVEKPEAPSSDVRVQHISMRTFLDNNKWREDCQKVFTRAEKHDFDWVAGTEAAREDHREILKAVAAKHGFVVGFGKQNDSWVAVRETFAKGKVSFSYYPVIDEPRNRGILVAEFNTENLGHIAVAACHYLRFGRPDAKSDEYEQYVQENKKLAKKIGDLAEEYARGSGLFFYSGDQNIPDNLSDTFFGEPLTSTWDELSKWDNTGHGNIDVIASYDKDKRVEAKWVRRLRDEQFPLHSDHYLVETGFSVRHLS